MRKAILLIILVMLSACSDEKENSIFVPPSSTTNNIESSIDPHQVPVVEKEILSDKENAKLCMESLTRERHKYSSTMFSILSSQVYLNKKFGLYDADLEQTNSILAKKPQPIFFSEEGDTILIYPGMGYRYTSIEMDTSKEKFNEMVRSSSEENKPWEVDAAQIKGLAGCSVLPFKDIAYTSTGGAMERSLSDEVASPAYDYLNTLNMWGGQANAASTYGSRINASSKNTEMFELNDQYVYVYFPDREIDTLILQHVGKGTATELIFSEIEAENGWHVFMAKTRESPWFENPPYVLDYTEGYSQFIIKTKGESIYMTNQYHSSLQAQYTDVIKDTQRSSIVGIYYAGEASLIIDSYQDGKIEGSLSRASYNLSKIAEASFSGEVVDNQLKFSFEGDGYGTEGLSQGVLRLNNHQLEVSLKIYPNEGDWSFTDGDLVFTKSLRTYLYE